MTEPQNEFCARTSNGWITWFPTFDAAETYARKLAIGSSGAVPIAITRGDRHLAAVRRDALDRVWTDLSDGDVA